MMWNADKIISPGFSPNNAWEDQTNHSVAMKPLIKDILIGPLGLILLCTAYDIEIKPKQRM